MTQNAMPCTETAGRLLRQAADILCSGGLIVYPTETFFGIGCRYDSEEAISRVFRSKRRLLAMPLPLIVADFEQLDSIAAPSSGLWEDIADLSSRFWPGPLTLILEARRHLSPLLTGGSGNIAVRISPHAVARELAMQVGCPLVSSSANISGQPAVTDAADLSSELVEAVDLVLDLPPRPMGGKASTIVRPLGAGKLELLRAGALEAERLFAAGYYLENMEQMRE